MNAAIAAILKGKKVSTIVRSPDTILVHGEWPGGLKMEKSRLALG